MGSMHELLAQVRHRVDVVAYRKMTESGILSEDDRVELIDGELIDMAPISSKHAFVVSRIAEFFTLAGQGACLVSVQNPIRLGDFSEPQPDIALLKPGNYMDRLPEADDVLLLIEVAYSSADYDRDVKLALYAKHRIPEVWLLDLAGNELTMCRDPQDGQYRNLAKPAAGTAVAPEALPGLQWRIQTGKTWAVPY